MLSVLKLLRVGVWYEPDKDHAENEVQTGDTTNQGVVPSKEFHECAGDKESDGGNNAAKVEANARARGAHAGREKFWQAQRQPAKIDAADEA